MANIDVYLECKLPWKRKAVLDVFIADGFKKYPVKVGRCYFDENGKWILLKKKKARLILTWK